MVQLRVLSALACILSCITLSKEQNGTPQFFSDECCTHKEVGGVRYTQVAGETDSFDCDGQCVYEDDSKPGSRICFKTGGLAPQPVECKASFIDSEFVPTDIITGGSFGDDLAFVRFRTKIGIFSCILNSNPQIVPDGQSINQSINQFILSNFSINTILPADSLLYYTDGVNVVCFSVPTLEITGSKHGNAFFFSQSPTGKNEYFSFHSKTIGIHCDFTADGGLPLTCHNMPPTVAEADILYVEGAQNVTRGEDEDDEIEQCQDLCNTNSSCVFWTLSFTPIPSTSRNHRGFSECGIRNYQVNVERPLPINSQNQFTGLKNQDVKNGSTFVFDYFPSPSPQDCKTSCMGQKSPDCTIWTWDLGTCALNVYQPSRRINITGRMPRPVLVSGCIGTLENSCSTLPDH